MNDILNFYKKYSKNNVTYYVLNNNDYLMCKIYFWLIIGLMLTSFTSLFLNKFLLGKVLMFYYKNNFLILLTIIIQFYISYLFKNKIYFINDIKIILLYLLFSIINGFNTSIFFLMYSNYEMFISFLIISLTFFFMIIYGILTKKDLTNLNNMLLTLLIGFINSIIINFYLNNKITTFIISYINLLTFVILIYYNNKNIKNLNINSNLYNNNYINKYIILISFKIYLNFINLFFIPFKLINIKI